MRPRSGSARFWPKGRLPSAAESMRVTLPATASTEEIVRAIEEVLAMQ